MGFQQQLTLEAKFMERAIEVALEGISAGEHPVGAVLTFDGEEVAAAGNRTHRDIDPTAHAEMVAIRMGAQALGRKNLSETTLYTTHEPCPMCASAAIFARVGCVVFGTTVEDAEAFVEAHRHEGVRWRSISVPMPRIVQVSDQRGMVVASGFLRERCQELFDVLLPPSQSKLQRHRF